MMYQLTPQIDTSRLIKCAAVALNEIAETAGSLLILAQRNYALTCKMACSVNDIIAPLVCAGLCLP